MFFNNPINIKRSLKIQGVKVGDYNEPISQRRVISTLIQEKRIDRKASVELIPRVRHLSKQMSVD